VHDSCREYLQGSKAAKRCVWLLPRFVLKLVPLCDKIAHGHGVTDQVAWVWCE
jgi:hypothetical protein